MKLTRHQKTLQNIARLERELGIDLPAKEQRVERRRALQREWLEDPKTGGWVLGEKPKISEQEWRSGLTYASSYCSVPISSRPGSIVVLP